MQSRLSKIWSTKRVWIILAIMFGTMHCCVDLPETVKAHEVSKQVSPSAVIDFEDEAVCIERDRGYFNVERKAKVTIYDDEELFDEETATRGIKISRWNAKGESLPISEAEVLVSGWTHEGRGHSAEVWFRVDGNYTWEISYKNLVGEKLEKISTGKSVTPFLFTIDREAPFGTITAISEEGSKVQWNKLADMGQWLNSGKEIRISGQFGDNTNQTAVKVFYYKERISAAKERKRLLTKLELDEISNWKAFENLDISKDQSCIVYLKVEDLSGNSTYLNTGILTVDTQEPVIEKLMTQAESSSSCRNGIFHEDVPILVRATEPEVGNTYSGIRKISYKIYNMGLETQSDVLYEASVVDAAKDNVATSWEGEFIVDSLRNNSNDVVVSVSVEDFSGNVTRKQIKLKIDRSRPIIEVSYDNNDAVNGKFFSSGRVATIVIRERNFNPEDVWVQITNSDGEIPKMSEWKKKEGSENLDNTEWIAQIDYRAEGDYTFDIKYCDLAGNQETGVDYGSSVSGSGFTIDETQPIIHVTYDNNETQNDNYYNKSRTATIEIEEHNLNVSDIKVYMNGEFEGEPILLPDIQNWNKEGDCYSTQILYTKDGTYTFDIEVGDKAGNYATDFKEETFHIDTVFPCVEIMGVDDKSSNRGDVSLEIICTDENILVEEIRVQLLDYTKNEVDVLYQTVQIENGVHYVYEKIPIERCMDNNYKLQVKMKDKAGNLTERTIRFSVNRFGSSYELGEETRQINHSYIHRPIDLVVEEMNVDMLVSSRVIVFKSGETILLEEGKDYQIDSRRDDTGNYWYRYRIFKENFGENGFYQVMISSEDAAGNTSDNNTTEIESSIQFGVDNIKPTLIVHNLESRKVYEVDTWTVELSARDNFRLEKIEVYLDHEIYRIWDGQEIEDLENNRGEFNFDIMGDSMLAHSVKIVCWDEAGNQCVEEISGFYVTTNKWIHVWKNKFLICGISILIVLIGAIILRIVCKKRSNPLSNFEK